MEEIERGVESLRLGRQENVIPQGFLWNLGK